VARLAFRPDLALALACLGLYVATAAQVRQGQGTALGFAFQSLSQPLVVGTTQLVQAAKDWASGRQDWEAILAELQDLRQQVARLSEENQLLASELLVLRQGHQLLAAFPSLQEQAVLAAVTARDLLGSHTLTVDRGRIHGVTRDCPVLGPEGVLGRVDQVTEKTARVQLLTHPAAAAAAQIVGVEGEALLLGGERPRLEGLPPYTQVPPGSHVVTTGSEGVYPPGLPLGVTGEPKLGAMFTEVPVKLSARAEAARVVMVLRRQRP